MVDYSKWDHMEFSDSEEDTDANLAPRVTSLDEPKRVTITNGGLEIGDSSLPSIRPNQTATSAAATSAPARSKAAQELAKNQKLQQWKAQLTRNGGEHNIIIQTKENGDVKLPIYWSQDRYAITLRLGFPHLIFPSRSIRVKVKGALNYKDRFSAVGSGAMSGYREVTNDGSAAFGSVEITSVSDDKVATVLLRDVLPRPVYINQNEDEIGFDIEDILTERTTSDDKKCTKFVSITLGKAVPMEGMIIWWENALLSLPKIDPSKIQERTNPVDKVMTVDEYNASMDKKQSGAGGDEAKREAFAKAWYEAHQLFREKVKNREKEEIHVDN